MHKFYFNECLPQCQNQHEFIGLLSQVLTEFKNLKSDNLQIESAIITEKLPSEIFLGNIYSLQSSIENIQDGNLKRLAFSYFNKYPIGSYFNLQEQEVDDLILSDFTIEINQQPFDATNIAIVGKNSGFLFTVPLHRDLKNNELSIIAKSKDEILSVNNLFGIESNTKFIEGKIKIFSAANTSSFERLNLVLGECRYNERFKRDFQQLAQGVKDSIADEFQKARDRDLATPFFADTKIIKEVTVTGKPKCKVFELRVYTPSAVRIYFNEGNGIVYMGTIAQKSNPDQNEDIQKAYKIIHKLILTE